MKDQLEKNGYIKYNHSIKRYTDFYYAKTFRCGDQKYQLIFHYYPPIWQMEESYEGELRLYVSGILSTFNLHRVKDLNQAEKIFEHFVKNFPEVSLVHL